MSDTAMEAGQGGAAPLPASYDMSEVGDWIALLKPRVMSLVVFSGLVGLLVAPGVGAMHPVLAVTAILCIAVASGAAGAINMWYDRDIDAVMRRTAKRPIPDGRIAPGAALAFGIWLAVASVTVMWMATNVAAAVILALSIAFYVFVYTMWLKRRTSQNIVIGGAAGAFPPVIGWAAVTGDVTAVPIILFAIIFMWTPPHFWSLALWAHDDYARAGVPMLPVTAGARETRRQIVIYSVVLAPLGLVPWLVGFSGPAYAAVAALLGAMFLRHAIAVLRDRQDEAGRSLTRDAPARACFRFSLYYLFILFAALAVDRLVLGA
ncbi:heme o synthase [Roseomonas sp. CAU 1739]|uniref:heme o synthase n=1 Tax=Roseomonas sp. CAU 1739 TaxID=3140364 RepID=UPI0038CF4BB9